MGPSRGSCASAAASFEVLGKFTLHTQHKFQIDEGAFGGLLGHLTLRRIDLAFNDNNPKMIIENPTHSCTVSELDGKITVLYLNLCVAAAFKIILDLFDSW